MAAILLDRANSVNSWKVKTGRNLGVTSGTPPQAATGIRKVLDNSKCLLFDHHRILPKVYLIANEFFSRRSKCARLKYSFRVYLSLGSRIVYLKVFYGR
jgi:hypothetical protein